MMGPSPGPAPGTLGPVVGELQESPAFIMAPRKSMTVSTKGLLNMPGQNNCFLNSAVQVLWHLDTFRRNFRELTGHSCMAESCIFCALKELFTQFQYSQESALPPDALRHALAKTFCDQRRFQLGFMDDAAECFENILLRIHVHIANQESEDMCSNVNCIPHQKFAMTLVEQRICQSCGARSDPLPFTQMVHYVTTSALCAKAMEKSSMDSTNRAAVSFGNFLRLAGEMGEVRDCPSNCGSKVQVKKTLMNHPEVVSIGLVWDSESPTLQHITDVFHSLGMFLQLQDMFHYVYDEEWAGNTTHQLVGIVTYYGKHYSTFFFHTKLKIWIYFDDAAVREIGPSWEQVVEKCQRGRFQPLLLLFANPESSIDSDHPMHFPSRPNDIKKQIPFINQRQAVINQYLKFQNSFYNSTNAKFDYNHSRTIPVHNLPHESYSNNVYRNGDQGLPIYQNTSHLNPAFPYNQTSPADLTNNSHPPVYSNLQYLNSLSPKDQADIVKLNEVSLPLVKSLPGLKSYDGVNVSEILLDKKDFDAAKDSDSAFTEDDPEGNDMYISRKTVENVLNQQKRQLSLCRSYSQSSVGNRNSSSSLESFDNIQPNKTVSLKNQLIENLSNRRDSGSWSNSDRNSCSSNNSGENPFLTVVTSKRLLLGLNKKSQLLDYSNTNTSDHGYDSYSVSSSDSYPSVNGSPVKLDPRMTQIPEDWQTEEDNDLDKKLKLVTEDTNGPPDCDKLCAEADLLLAKSHEKEKDGDLVMAALLCDSAAARARAAMEAPYNNSRSLVSAKMKHSTCVMRSSNLYRRLKDHEVDERRKQKGHIGHHSRQSSRDSTHSKHSRQSSKDSTHSKSGSKESNPNSDETGDNFGKNIEIYGTLPKKGSRKKNNAASGSLKTKDDQVYKDFLDKQRRNTSLAESLNETMMKNVDVSKNESNIKPKSPVSPDKSHRKSYSEGVTPKSPTRKKVDIIIPKNSDSEGRKRTQKQLVEPSSHSGSKNAEIGGRDLLSPITPPDKKQHKIKRKLMGGFMKRKNRSLPDLREDQDLSDRVDCFLDDAIIQVPSTMMLPNGKAKTIDKQSDSGIGSMTRGFHQPHHAFVKKDLTQRPLLMKVNPPNIQPSVLENPKSKLLHTLPSISKKSPDSNIKSDSTFNSILKPSKIPFISPFPKCESTNLPPLTSPKSVEAKILPKSGLLSKTSAIPVLTPQVSIASLKSVNPVKEETITEINKQPASPVAQSSEKEDILQISNPFLAEIQAKRKQVLNKSFSRNESPESKKSSNIQSDDNENKEFSMLPKLARNAEGTSWLKELQSKQQQLLNKQDDFKGFSKAVNNHELQPVKSPATRALDIVEESKHIDNVDGHSRKILPVTSIEMNKDLPYKTETNINKKTVNSVKDIASRFEKVLKMPTSTTAFAADQERINNVKISEYTGATRSEDEFVKTNPDITLESLPNPSVSTCNTLPLKPALKAWTEFHTSNETISNSNHTDCDTVQERTIVKPILKQDSNTNSLETASDMSNSNMHRPMQPPDYETAMQRLERIRTSSSDANLLPVEQIQTTADVPKKKQGPKKTVTFSDEVVLVACAEYDEIDFSSNPLFERVYQQHVESGKGEIPILSGSYNPHAFGRNMHEDLADDYDLPPPPPSIATSYSCNLCHNKQISQPNLYCTDCEFYLSRFKP